MTAPIEIHYCWEKCGSQKRILIMASTEAMPNKTTEAAETSSSAKATEPKTLTKTSSDGEQVKPDTDRLAESESYSGPIFQAVGVIVGAVNFSDDGKHTVSIGRNKYPLFYVKRNRVALLGLKKEIEATGDPTQRLIVYPKVTHFPKRDQPHFLAFQLVGFDKGRDKLGVSEELADFEFKLSGLWQFIPVCRTPCISIFRNFSQDRLDYIKQAEPALKVKYMKASHLPVLWRDAPVRPFRFNPKGGKEQGHPPFVQIKAKFLPHRDAFGFVEQLAEPKENAPRFLKASKKDKAEIQQTLTKSKSLPKPKPKSKIPPPRKTFTQ